MIVPFFRRSSSQQARQLDEARIGAVTAPHEQQLRFRELAEVSALWSSDFLHGGAICCRL
jgi:hypothetical protein